MDNSVEEMHRRLLEGARRHVAECGETFCDMFHDGGQTEARRFFLSLSKSERDILERVATAEALLVG